MSTCKLCGQDKPLVNAHIIPESMYPFEGTPRQPLQVVASEKRGMRRQSPKGEYDPNLVCAGCEARFGPWDDYAARLLRRKPQDKDYLVGNKCEGAYQVQTYSYEKLKLFFISLLWRASETQRLAFSEVNVGPKYTKRIAEMICQSNPGDAEEFATFLIRYTHPRDAHKAVMTPQKQRWDGIFFYRFYLGGYMAGVKVDKRSAPPPYSRFVLRPGKPLLICVMPFQKTAEYREMVRTLRRER